VELDCTDSSVSYIAQEICRSREFSRTGRILEIIVFDIRIRFCRYIVSGLGDDKGLSSLTHQCIRPSPDLYHIHRNMCPAERFLLVAPATTMRLTVVLVLELNRVLVRLLGEIGLGVRHVNMAVGLRDRNVSRDRLQSAE
jgi:hypothetical protein